MKKLSGFTLIPSGYLQNQGVDVMAFDDFYPEGHQSGVSIIMHGNRVASNGDVRITSYPFYPKQDKREINEKANTISTALHFPDDTNPVRYTVTVKGEGESVLVTAALDKPLPNDFPGKVWLTMELYPGALFGKLWMMDDKQGIFPDQPNAPALSPSGNGNIYEPYAVGKSLIIQPDDPYNRLIIEAIGTRLVLADGRMDTQNGWFTLSSEIAAGQQSATWVITPNIVPEWRHNPVIQVSQVGYHPNQPKAAVIELDKRVTEYTKPELLKLSEAGFTPVHSADGAFWGSFLRYHYLKFDFTAIKTAGLYKIRYGESESSVFRISEDIYDRGIWQPVLEYFLPIQMCHMRVNEKARVWHDFCHDDDAQMAPVNHVHFDGYEQGPSTLTKYKPGETVPGLNIGGWHDAGDDDLRVESQAGEVYILAMAYEAFDVDYDVTTIDQEKRVVEIHQPDGKNDILQQIEHGVLSVVGAYLALGRLYRGIITNNIKQYALLGDPAVQTDNIAGNDDDRWVFTEDNPHRELMTAAQLAAAARVLKGFNDVLSEQTLEAAKELFTVTDASGDARPAKIHAAVELFLTTHEPAYKDFLLSEINFIVQEIGQLGWIVARVDQSLNDADFSKAIRDSLPGLHQFYDERSAETPYGIPYRPHIWGAGWDIQRLGFEYYFLHKTYPDVFAPDMVFNALNFVLGCHPGSNNMSFATGIGTKSALVAYGWNRADWSGYPGGVISGTALIRPDFPELLVYPYLWQQTEYVLGGGSSHYMFLVLAAQQITKGLTSAKRV